MMRSIGLFEFSARSTRSLHRLFPIFGVASMRQLKLKEEKKKTKNIIELNSDCNWNALCNFPVNEKKKNMVFLCVTHDHTARTNSTKPKPRPRHVTSARDCIVSLNEKKKKNKIAVSNHTLHTHNTD